MSGFSFETEPATKPVKFTLRAHVDDSGKAIEFTHHLRSIAGLEELELLESIDVAKLELPTEIERAKASVRLYAEAWERLAVHPDARVQGYGSTTIAGASREIESLRGPELVEYFRGGFLPADLEPERRTQIVAQMTAHKATAVSAYLKEPALDESFRGVAEGEHVEAPGIPTDGEAAGA